MRGAQQKQKIAFSPSLSLIRRAREHGLEFKPMIRDCQTSFDEDVPCPVLVVKNGSDGSLGASERIE